MPRYTTRPYPKKKAQQGQGWGLLASIAVPALMKAFGKGHPKASSKRKPTHRK